MDMNYYNPFNSPVHTCDGRILYALNMNTTLSSLLHNYPLNKNIRNIITTSFIPASKLFTIYKL